MSEGIEIRIIQVDLHDSNKDIILIERASSISYEPSELYISRDEAEEIYDRLDFILHDETRAEIEKQLEDLELREDKLRESVVSAETEYEEPDMFYDLVI